jgi:hypothetical protein
VAVKVATQAHQEPQAVRVVAEVVAQEDKEGGLVTHQLYLLPRVATEVMRQDRQILEPEVVAELAQPDHRQQLMQAETVE